MNAAPGGGDAINPSGRFGDLAVGAVALLTVGSLLLAQHIKHLPAPVESVVIKPARLRPGTPPGRFAISFHLDQTNPITVSIVNGQGDTVATLARNLRWPGNVTLCLAWDGRRGVGAVERPKALPANQLLRCAQGVVQSQPTGRLVGSGEYRLQVTFLRSGRALTLPQTFSVVGGGG